MSTATAPPLPSTPELQTAPIRVDGPSPPPRNSRIGDTEFPGETRIVIRGVTWEFYKHFVDGIPEHSHVRTAFDGKDLEIMTKSFEHEDFRELLGEIAKVVTQELGIPGKPLAEVTWKRPELERGIEADQCFYFQREKLEAAANARRQKLRDISHYPNPDLAIEVDISPSKVDRPGIYAAMEVTEVWRFDGETLVIERLTPEKTYVPVEASGYVPIAKSDIIRWILDEDTTDFNAWSLRLRAWVRAELVPRLNPEPNAPETETEQGTESA